MSIEQAQLKSNTFFALFIKYGVKLLLLIVLILVFMLYTQPNMLILLADNLWGCA